MIEVSYAPSFLRIIKKLDPHLKEKVKETTSNVIDLYVSGQKTAGLGITHLRGTLWEARTGIRVRIVYDLTKNCLTFILAGSHDDIKNFLKQL